MTLRTSYLTVWTPERVQLAADEHAADGPVAFANYAQQELGIGYPTVKDMVLLRRKLKEFFQAYPQGDYYTLCRLVAWAKARRKWKRFTRVWNLIEAHRDALRDGALPELQVGAINRDLEVEIVEALTQEPRPEWRRRLMGAAGEEARAKALDEWRVDAAGAVREG